MKITNCNFNQTFTSQYYNNQTTTKPRILNDNRADIFVTQSNKNISFGGWFSATPKIGQIIDIERLEKIFPNIKNIRVLKEILLGDNIKSFKLIKQKHLFNQKHQGAVAINNKDSFKVYYFDEKSNLVATYIPSTGSGIEKGFVDKTKNNQLYYNNRIYYDGDKKVVAMYKAVAPKNMNSSEIAYGEDIIGVRVLEGEKPMLSIKTKKIARYPEDNEEHFFIVYKDDNILKGIILRDRQGSNIIKTLNSDGTMTITNSVKDVNNNGYIDNMVINIDKNGNKEYLFRPYVADNSSQAKRLYTLSKHQNGNVVLKDDLGKTLVEIDKTTGNEKPIADDIKRNLEITMKELYYLNSTYDSRVVIANNKIQAINEIISEAENVVRENNISEYFENFKWLF